MKRNGKDRIYIGIYHIISVILEIFDDVQDILIILEDIESSPGKDISKSYKYRV